MKSEFKARPVYLSRDDRITAHFTTCFLSLVIHRFLEKRLMEKFTSSQIIDCLRDMNFTESFGNGYIPAYTRTDLTDALHDVSGFRTDYQILTNMNFKKILKNLKKWKHCANSKSWKYLLSVLSAFNCQISEYSIFFLKIKHIFKNKNKAPP